MSRELIFNSGYIVGMQIEESFGKYSISCRVGAYCDFDLNMVSNQLHTHNSYELCIVTSGSGIFFYDGKKFKLQRGDVFIADPYIIHEIQINNHQYLQLIYFFIDIINNELSMPKSPEDQMLHTFLNQHAVLVNSQMHLLAYFSFIEDYNAVKRSRGFGIYHSIKNLILESLDCLSNKSDNFSKSLIFTCNALEQSLDYIDNNLNKKITLGEISRHSRTSVRNLQYLFKKHLNKTIIEYSSERKINLAAHYLMMQFSVQDTANLIGITAPAQFTKMFKKYKAISPKKYQQLHAPKEKGFGRRL